MKKELEDLKNQLSETIKAIEEQEESQYRNQKHRSFDTGDWVTDGDNIGVVEWIENKGMNMSEDDGYMGVSLKTGRLGFKAGCKRDDFWRIPESDRSFFVSEHTLTISLTGEEMISLNNYDIPRNINPSSAKNKILDAINNNFDLKILRHKTC